MTAQIITFPPERVVRYTPEYLALYSLSEFVNQRRWASTEAERQRLTRSIDWELAGMFPQAEDTEVSL